MVQARGKLVHLGCRTLPHPLSDLNRLCDFLLVGTAFQGAGYIYLQARLAVGRDGRSNGDQSQSLFVKLHGVSLLSDLIDEGQKEKDTPFGHPES
jgi:hypothetical protein